jgi:hypothetical protein
MGPPLPLGLAATGAFCSLLHQRASTTQPAWAAPHGLRAWWLRQLHRRVRHASQAAHSAALLLALLATASPCCAFPPALPPLGSRYVNSGGLEQLYEIILESSQPEIARVLQLVRRHTPVLLRLLRVLRAAVGNIESLGYRIAASD